LYHAVHGRRGKTAQRDENWAEPLLEHWAPEFQPTCGLVDRGPTARCAAQDSHQPMGFCRLLKSAGPVKIKSFTVMINTIQTQRGQILILCFLTYTVVASRLF
jgi:hypothetical protein